MERIEFRIVEEKLGVGVFSTLVPHLNGVPLPDLVGKLSCPSRDERGTLTLPAAMRACWKMACAGRVGTTSGIPP